MWLLAGYVECKNISAGSSESDWWSLRQVKVTETEHYDDCTDHVAI